MKFKYCSGYIVSEYAMHDYLTDKTDVYSFGILALEIISGKTNTIRHPNGAYFSLLDWVTYILMFSFIHACQSICP